MCVPKPKAPVITAPPAPPVGALAPAPPEAAPLAPVFNDPTGQAGSKKRSRGRSALKVALQGSLLSGLVAKR